jgi:hypothetical protein
MNVDTVIVHGEYTCSSAPRGNTITILHRATDRQIEINRKDAPKISELEHFFETEHAKQTA